MKSFFFICILACSVWCFTTPRLDSQEYSGRYIETYSPNTDSLKLAAFHVLESKCNECHQKKKPTYFFTLDNMGMFANDIHKQVFVKEKMPKGRGNELSDQERSTLLKWLKSR